jgi:alpha-D-xyloside xylohydrolase
MGVDGFKTDFGEQVPEDAVFFDGRTGRELHNIFPRLYNQATYEAMSDATHGVLLARSAWDGSQAYCAIWAGDQSSDFGPATGLPSVIVAAQSAGISGFPFWASDIGGYFGTPTEEVFIRWIQFGAFSPIMQIHGLGLREPWNFSERVLEIYRRYAQLHLDLFPYLYTYAHIAHKTGVPIVRALAVEFPNDPGIWSDESEHEYCFGSELLVAPVYWGGDRFRSTYLPRGAWRDFWNGRAYEGGALVRLPAELASIPVLARAGSIIPFLDPSPETLLPTHAERASIKQAGSDLRVHVYPGADGKFEMYDGTRFEWRESVRTLRVQSPTARAVSVRIVGENLKLSFTIAHEVGNLNGDLNFVSISVQPNHNYDLVYS